MCKPPEVKHVTSTVENTPEDEIVILTTIDDYDVSEYLSHAENVNNGGVQVEGHAYHSNGNSIVVPNDDSAQA